MAATATARHAAAGAGRRGPRFPGAVNIFRKELREWFRTRRFLVTAVTATLIMTVIPVGVWIAEHDGLSAGRATLAGSEAVDARRSGAATLLTLSTYLAMLLTKGMLVNEREAGTAQWLFTKPVSRAGYGLAKWAANSLGVVLATVAIPGAVAFGLVTAMYDVPGWSWAGQILGACLAAVHATIVVALMLALGTLFRRSTVPIAVVALGLSFAPMFLAPLVGSRALQLMPISRLDDLVTEVVDGRAVGASDLAPLAAGLVCMALCLVYAGYRLTREQLQ